MPTWLSYMVYVLVIFVAIAPRRALGPLAGLLNRYVGVGVVALLCLGAGAWTLGAAQSDRARWTGLGELALGALCAVWWLYRLFRPAYRDQAPDSSPIAGD